MAIAADLDLAAIIPPGATLAWGEGAAEPRTLTAALSAQHERLRGRRVLLGITPGDLGVLAAADGLGFISYGGLGAGAALQRSGRLQIMPCHMSALVRMIVTGELRAEVVLAQVSPPGPDGRCSLGVTASYLVPLLDRAPVAIAEVNSQMPATHGDTTVRLDRFSDVVEASYPLPAIARGPASDDDDQLAGHVARLVPDGAVLQVGVGSVLGAVTRRLAGKRDLAIHFSRAATASPRGRSVIAVRSTARHGTVSRIVPRLTSGVATLARSDVDTVVTEYGAADLRTGTLTQRAQRLAAIAHPKFRAELLQGTAVLRERPENERAASPGSPPEDGDSRSRCDRQ